MRHAYRLAAVVSMLMVFAVAPAWCGQSRADKPAFKMEEERIGSLRLGMPEQAVAAAVTCAGRKSAVEAEAATGWFVWSWKMPECGLDIGMYAESRTGPWAVNSIMVTAPSKAATSRGIHIGSSEAEVEAAYGDVQDMEGTSESGQSFIAGSIYGGLMLRFEEGRVTGMFLGAAAE